MYIGKVRISKKIFFTLLAIALALIDHFYFPIPKEMIYSCWVYVGGQGAADAGIKLGQQIIMLAERLSEGGDK